MTYFLCNCFVRQCVSDNSFIYLNIYASDWRQSHVCTIHTSTNFQFQCVLAVIELKLSAFKQFVPENTSLLETEGFSTDLYDKTLSIHSQMRRCFMRFNCLFNSEGMHYVHQRGVRGERRTFIRWTLMCAFWLYGKMDGTIPYVAQRNTEGIKLYEL